MSADLGTYDNPVDIGAGIIDGLQSPRRMSVSEATAKHTHTQTGLWSPDLTPYMIKPMDCSDSRRYTSVIIAGPARSGKTAAMAEGMLTHAVMCDPGDMAMYFPTEDNARDFSYRRIDRMHQYSPELGARLSTHGHDNNIMRKRYRSGMMIDFLYPASSQLAQREFRKVLLSDFDAMPQDVSGEGSPFDLAAKRTQTYLSGGCTVAESSPRFEIIKRGWAASRQHEAPPVAAGVLALYNRGDRRRWYWRCMGCSHPFEAPPLPAWEDNDPSTAHVACPKCGHRHNPTDKRRLNLQSELPGDQWVAAGQEMQSSGEITGASEYTGTASFWFFGCAAAFQPWESLVQGELHGLADLAASGSEDTIKTKRNIDQGVPYTSRAIESALQPQQLQQGADDMARCSVPDGARVVTAAVDVQIDRFVVQVQAWGPGRETWIVDRFDILTVDDAGRPRRVAPADFADDWHEIASEVIESMRYADADGVVFPVALTLCDSGGMAGVAYHAYDFARWCRAGGLSRKMTLIKGASMLAAPLIAERYPVSNDSAKKSAARGDVKVLFINTNTAKDEVAHSLGADGNAHLPAWAPMSFFEELCAEARGPDGKWSKVNSGDRNESLDLMVYNLAAIRDLGCDSWGDEWERIPNFAPQSIPKHTQRKPSGGFAPDAWASRGFR